MGYGTFLNFEDDAGFMSVLLNTDQIYLILRQY